MRSAFGDWLGWDAKSHGRKLACLSNQFKLYAYKHLQRFAAFIQIECNAFATVSSVQGEFNDGPPFQFHHLSLTEG